MRGGVTRSWLRLLGHSQAGCRRRALRRTYSFAAAVACLCYQQQLALHVTRVSDMSTRVAVNIAFSIG